MPKKVEPPSVEASPHWKHRQEPLHFDSKQSKPLILMASYCVSGLLLGLSLASFSPQDPSLNSTSALKGPIHNHVGVVGAYVSDLLLQSFGYGAYGILVLLLLGLTTQALSGKTRTWWQAGSIRFLWILALSALLEWTANPAPPMTQTFSAGGVLGLLSVSQIQFWLGLRGGWIALWAGFLSLTWILQPLSWDSLKGYLIQGGKWVAQRVLLALRLSYRALRAQIAKAYNQWRQRQSHTPDSHEPIIHSPLDSPPTASVNSAPTFQPVSPMVIPMTLQHEPVDVTPETGDIDSLLRAADSSVRPQIELDHTEKEQGAVKAPFIDDANYSFPSFDYLEDPPPALEISSRKELLKDNARILVNKLKAFTIEGTVQAICPGPVITMYEFAPQEGVKISRIANLADDLSLALSAESVRIIAPIPGKSVVGIEIPNEFRETITLKEVLRHSQFQESSYRIPLALGKDIAGETFAADLYQMPHLLVAGSTGSGKSVFINTAICSLLYKFTPSQLRMILIDPKMVELSVYDEIPHLLLPVVTDSQKASLALQWAVDEMERRYELMHDLQVRNIESYNRKIQSGLESGDQPHLEHNHLPMVVIVVDELADLMMTCPKDVEVSICRLAQKARAAGIHLIVATQRPDTSVITGTIKANFPSRISFRVSSRVDSATILDDKGAERLLGRGDMLVRLMGMSRITRLHGAFVSEKEVEQIVAHVRLQGEPTYDETILMPRDDGPETPEEDLDDVYDKALEVVSRERVASISLVQRRLRIGYNRAARIIETMERQGIIAPSDGTSRPRKVLIPPPPP